MSTTTLSCSSRKRPRAPTLEILTSLNPFTSPSSGSSKRFRTNRNVIQEVDNSGHAIAPSRLYPTVARPFLSPALMSSPSISSSSSSSSSDAESEPTLQNDSSSSSSDDEQDDASISSDSPSSSSSSSSSSAGADSDDDSDSDSSSASPRPGTRGRNISLSSTARRPVLDTAYPAPPPVNLRQAPFQPPHMALPNPLFLTHRLATFLPALSAANQELEIERVQGRLSARDIENLDDMEGDEEGGQYIEMDLGLGVLEEREDDEDRRSDGEVDLGDKEPMKSGAEGGNGMESDVLGRLMGVERTIRSKPEIEIVDGIL